MKWISCLAFGLLLTISGAANADGWNNPHQAAANANVRYSAITGSPKTLDPARAYSSDEIQILSQIYEPLLQYHYLKRPYQLIPLTAIKMPVVRYYDKNNKALAANAPLSSVAYTLYDIEIKPGIRYQPHPAFAKNAKGEYLYHHLSPEQVSDVYSIDDFEQTGTREMQAADYAYQIKRLASPKTHSPILSLMNKYIVGLKSYAKTLERAYQKIPADTFFDLRQFPLSGVKVLSPYHLQIKIRGVYPQFRYWLAMTFFVPIPWEADAFYSQPGLEDHNITLSWYPVGTGPYMIEENNPNKQIVMISNLNFRGEKFPVDGDSSLQDKQMPFIEKVIFVLDKESIPRWNKFLQGYYDKSGVGADSFDQAIKIGKDGKPDLTSTMKKRGIQLHTTVEPGIYYMGFNMADPVVGGYSEKKRKLRQAIGIAMDYEEYISIFLNGRGIPAQGPIPPSIFGYVEGEKGLNPYIYEWFEGKPKRKSLREAKKLLAEAGYPRGINPKTGKPLILNYDAATSGNPDDKAHFDWLRKQFARLGIKLNIRATLYNRFQDKIRSGKAQIFSWGWMADYPDPENFLFLLYGPNGKMKHGGENAANYDNPKVNALFTQIRAMPDGPARQQKIDALIQLVRKDSPWLWGFHPISFTLSHQWNSQSKPNPMARNTLKYEKIDTAKRQALRQAWNRPVLWPFFVLIACILLIALPLWYAYRRRLHRPTVKKTVRKQ